MKSLEQFEQQLLETCNTVAELAYNTSAKLNNGVSEISREQAFEFAKSIVFKSYEAITN
jgi:hypothetical protein